MNSTNHCKTPFILCFTKVDLLKDLLQKVQFKQFCDNYDGENTVDGVLSFFKQQYAENNKINAKLRSWDVIYS